MSKKRNSGEIVYKTPGAGFCGDGLVIIVGGEKEPCLMCCGDSECSEWSDCLVLKNGEFVYHVSECQMEDLDQ